VLTGKALDSKVVDVQVNFRNRYPFPSNKLTIEIQPQAKISMTAHMKPLGGVAPGGAKDVATAALTTNYSFEGSDDFISRPIENAYSRLLLDVLRGKQNSFVRSDELVRSWEVFTPLLHQIERDNVLPMTYTYGSSGPSARSVFLEEMSRTNIKASL
jgi:glucose-6-phosphate 1-dehydrogenase